MHDSLTKEWELDTKMLASDSDMYVISFLFSVKFTDLMS
jgi:hypothetical protein